MTTNREKLTKMSNEELARWLGGTINCKLYYIEGIRYDDEFKFLIAAQIYKNSNNIEE